MIASLAGNMKQGQQTENKTVEERKTEDEISDNTEILPAVSEKNLVSDTVQTAFPKDLSGCGAGDRRVALLNAIRPYVSNSKRERVDGLVKAISVAGILNTYTGGLFGNGKQ